MPIGSSAQVQSPNVLKKANGAENVGYGSRTVSQRFDQLNVDDYVALRALNTALLSNQQSVFVADVGLYGEFVIYNSESHGLSDNGGTTIVIDSDWYAERVFSGAVNILWYGAEDSPNVESGTIVDSDTAFTSAFTDAKARFTGIFAPGGDYVFSTPKNLDWDGAYLKGDSDFHTNIWYDGTSDDAIIVGDKKVSVTSTSQVCLEKFRIRLTENAVVNNVFYLSASSFQTYFYRIRYARSYSVPADSVILSDSNVGTDYTVRTVIKDSYFEGTPYGGYVGAADCGLWVVSAIQMIVDNCHFQDFETNVRLGSDDPSYIQDQVADFFMINNSRLQHGDRGQLVGTGEGVEIIGQCNNINFVDTTIYCNNNAPSPAYSNQIPFRIRGDVNGGSITRLTTNLNSRSDYFIDITSTATVDDLTIFDVEVLNPKAQEMINIDSSAVTDGITFERIRYDNPNADFINKSLTGNTNHTINLDAYNVGELNVDSGTTETINAFSGGTLGVPCYIHCNVISGQLDLNAASDSIYFNGTSTVTITDDSVLEVIPFKFNANKRYMVTLVSRQLTRIDDLNQTISGSYTQAEVQAISDKVDELLAALNTQGYIRSF